MMPVEFLQHTAAEEFVLLTEPTPLGHGRPSDDSAASDDLLRPKLLPGEVDLDPQPYAIPPVVVPELAVDLDLTPDQLAAEEVIEDHGGDPALAPGWVVRAPSRAELRRARVSTPATANSTLDVTKKQWHGEHARNDH
jgi:hypothetical protein